MSEPTGAEVLARMRAEADQAMEGMKTVAKGSAAFYKQLRDEGLNENVAVALTQTWLSSITLGTLGQGEDGEEQPGG